MTLAGYQALIDNANAIIPLVDLCPLGNFVEHYACAVTNLELDYIMVSSLSSTLVEIVIVSLSID